MASSAAERKLTAVFVTDVVGYSRLMGDDHEATVKILAEFRDVFSKHIASSHGRVVNAPGDSILAEFSSVVDSVSAAVAIQRELSDRNASLPESRRMHFRIGINLGDVLIKDGELFGDGVNIAARLEALAEPGGICISRPVFDQVESRLPLHYEYIGEHRVKNIAQPVRAYKVALEAGMGTGQSDGESLRSRSWPRTILAAAAVLTVVVAGLLAWNFTRQPEAPVAGGEAAPFKLPGKPSIAVLAFDNLSGDPKQEYFSDGISENIITSLSKLNRLFVTARNSSFAYKGKQTSLRRIGDELGVRYLLEGSVQKAGGRVRINAQLIDTSTETHLWAERYDRDLTGIFALQDELTEKIVAALKVQLTTEEVERVRRNTTTNVQAWENYAQGMREFNRIASESFVVARIYFEKSLELDPNFGAAVLGLGWTYQFEGRFPGTVYQTGPHPLKRAAGLAESTLKQNGSTAEAYALLGQISLADRRHDQAISHGRRAVELNPNGADWHAYLAESLSYAGRPEDALRELEQARRLNPLHPNWYLTVLGRSQYLTGQYERAASSLREVMGSRAKADFPADTYRAFVVKAPAFAVSSANLLLIASLVAADSVEEAKEQVAKFRIDQPNLKPGAWLRNNERFRDPAIIDRIVADLAKAGLE